ncbi:MAG: AbrB/MazE/SpoVT family DNA-binding domain-containing protein [Candidatus Lokiarchaeota archaeon]|nr:AbrB/MazE/SpoVT family DNA-binding domain-containing protein [Candidatus Lokiarchaeota archaeon]
MGKYIFSNFLTLIMEIARISTKGQVVIPKEIRDRAGLKDGDAVVVKLAGKSIIIEKIDDPRQPMVELLKRGEKVHDNMIRELRNEW